MKIILHELSAYGRRGRKDVFLSLYPIRLQGLIFYLASTKREVRFCLGEIDSCTGNEKLREKRKNATFFYSSPSQQPPSRPEPERGRPVPEAAGRAQGRQGVPNAVRHQDAQE